MPAAGTRDISGKGITLGPVTIGGAMRVNYIYGDYDKVGDEPQCGGNGGNGGNVELDTFESFTRR
jgi:hypothetical protein